MGNSQPDQRRGLLLPFATFALQQLQRQAPTRGTSLLPAGATDGLLQSLLDFLLWILGPTLEVLQKGRVVGAANHGHHPVDSRKEFQALDDLEIPDVLLSFPAIRETIQLVVSDWISTNTEMLRRLHRDRCVLAAFRSCPDNASWTVAHIGANLSDRHGRGRSVCALTFADGDRLIYKPRECCGEQLWCDILDWLHQEGFAELKAPRMVYRPRSRYSWVEFLPASPCSDECAVQRFYFRWGAQAALATLFGFADLHHDNWIAMHEHPVLVDAEMFGADASELERKGSRVTRLEPLFATGLLPFGSESGLEYRGLGPFDLRSSFAHVPDCWPCLEDVARPPHEFASNILRGFYDVVEFIWAKRSRIRGINSILSQAASYESRALVRSTGEYEQVLRQSLHPRHMLTKQSRYQGLLASCYPAAPAIRIAEAEADSLLHCCVPRFTAKMLGRNPRRLATPTRKAMATALAHLSSHLASSHLPDAIGARVS